MVSSRGWRGRRVLELHLRRAAALVLAAVAVLVGLLLVTPAASAAPTPNRTVVAHSSLPASLTATKCKGYSWFGGVHWCPADALGVAQTRYGLGRRVWLGGVVVNQVNTDSVLVSQFVPCPDGHFCGASGGYNSWNSLTLRWSGSHRPKVNAIIRLYGTTTTGSLDPAGYVWTGTYVPCPDPYYGC